MYSKVEGPLSFLGDPELVTATSTFSGAARSEVPSAVEIAPQGWVLTGMLTSDVQTFGASFYAVQLQQVFRNAYFCESTFQSANLDGCQFIGCEMRDVAFDFASLRGVRFINCDIDASFGECDLSFSTFSECRMDVLFVGTVLTGTTFDDVTLRGALRDIDVSTVRARNSTLHDLAPVTPQLFTQLMNCGFSVEDRDHDMDLRSLFEVLDTAPADETEAWYRRNIVGERFIGDP